MTGQIVMGTPAPRRYATIGQGGRRGWWMPPLKGGGGTSLPFGRHVRAESPQVLVARA